MVIILSISDISGLYYQFDSLKKIVEKALKELDHGIKTKREIYKIIIMVFYLVIIML